MIKVLESVFYSNYDSNEEKEQVTVKIRRKPLRILPVQTASNETSHVRFYVGDIKLSANANIAKC